MGKYFEKILQFGGRKMQQFIIAMSLLVGAYMCVYLYKRALDKRIKVDDKFKEKMSFLNSIVPIFIVFLEKPLLAAMCVYPGIAFYNSFGNVGLWAGSVVLAGIYLCQMLNRKTPPFKCSNEVNQKILKNILESPRTSFFIRIGHSMIRLLCCFFVASFAKEFLYPIIVFIPVFAIVTSVTTFLSSFGLGIGMAIFKLKAIKETLEEEDAVLDLKEKDFDYQGDDEECYPSFIEFPWTTNDVPSEEEMRIFFTAEIILERLFFCPNINRDMTDDWGIFGYEEGFIFVEGALHNSVQCLNDLAWREGGQLKESTDYTVPELLHYDFFPRNKFSSIAITESRHLTVFQFLRKELRRD